MSTSYANSIIAKPNATDTHPGRVRVAKINIIASGALGATVLTANVITIWSGTTAAAGTTMIDFPSPVEMEDITLTTKGTNLTTVLWFTV